jgi:hypothetical protein
MANRRIIATLYRGKKQQKIWVRYYNWMDTAMPRAVQLALCYGVPGDVVEFASVELGFQIGTLTLLPKQKVELTYSPLVQNSASLLKLLNQGD